MLFKRQRELPVLHLAILLLVIAFAFVVGACPEETPSGTPPTVTQEEKPPEEVPPKNYVSGEDALSWGVSTNANVLTLGLTPGDDTTKINLNWYSSGSTASKVAKVRFIKGTLTEGTELIEENGNVSFVTGGTTAYSAHKVTVSGLEKGASYQYAVSSDGDNWSDAYDFKIPAGNTFKFAVIADPQLHNTTWDANNRYVPATSTTSRTAQGWLATMAKIVSHGVSFIASGGDQVDSYTASEDEYTMFFAPPGLRSLPFAPVSGNHDSHTQYTFHYNWPNAQDFTGETTQYDQGSRNYFYLYNNILFVVLNTAPYPTSTSLAQPIVQRFDDTLKAAIAAHPTYDWLIVQHHKSTASVADHLADTDIQYYVEAGFESVMSKYKVDFVLAGHDHVYARSYPLEGKDGGLVSEPDKSANVDGKAPNTYTNPGKPIYLTFTTGSGLKYYQVSIDKQFPYNNTLYVKDNAKYPYLVKTDGSGTTAVGSTNYLSKDYMPVSNAAWVQPYIPSYCIVEVNGKTIKFSTYPIVTKSGTSTFTPTGGSLMTADEGYSYNENTPYDWVEVTKTN